MWKLTTDGNAWSHTTTFAITKRMGFLWSIEQKKVLLNLDG